MSPFDEYVAREREYERKALELTKGCPPEFNIAPYIELVRAADALGFDVISKPIVEGK